MGQVTQLTDEVIQDAIEKATEKLVSDITQNANQSIVFYCKNCKEIVFAEKKGKSLTFTCPKCSQSNIAIGTQKSIESYYRLAK